MVVPACVGSGSSKIYATQLIRPCFERFHSNRHRNPRNPPPSSTKMTPFQTEPPTRSVSRSAEAPHGDHALLIGLAAVLRHHATVVAPETSAGVRAERGVG